MRIYTLTISIHDNHTDTNSLNTTVYKRLASAKKVLEESYTFHREELVAGGESWGAYVNHSAIGRDHMEFYQCGKLDIQAKIQEHDLLLVEVDTPETSRLKYEALLESHRHVGDPTRMPPQ